MGTERDAGLRPANAERQRGHVFDVALADLTAAARIADGGHGRVYRLADPPGLLLKLYHGGTTVLPEELGRLIDLPGDRRELGVAPVAWPSGRVFDGGRCVGLLMPEAPAEFATSLAGRRRLLELQFLLYPRRAMWADLVLPTRAQRRGLAMAYAELFRVLHGNGVVVGDVSMRNLLWTLAGGPSVYVIDCDGFRLAGRPSTVRPADTAGWGDPARPDEVTVDTDRYKLALVMLRVLLGNHEVTPEDVRTRELLRRMLGPELAALAGHAARPGRRPPAECWLGAIGAR
jgi:DNA-binding helix-hairpin-helix protein with protein kinase domain